MPNTDKHPNTFVAPSYLPFYNRYELDFWVYDVSQSQSEVEANVTVEVTSLTPTDVTEATLLVLEVDPYLLVKQDQVSSLINVNVFVFY